MPGKKNWLIRTQNHQILGPVSLTKIKELLTSHALSAHDEICSGNGYWLYVRETDLLEKFIINEEVQPFNIISEAKTVVAKSGPSSGPPPQMNLSASEDAQLPSAEDLEYPDGSCAMAAGDLTLAINMKTLQQTIPSASTSASTSAAASAPDHPTRPAPQPVPQRPVEKPARSATSAITQPQAPQPQTQSPSPSRKHGDRYLIVLTGLIIIVMTFAIVLGMNILRHYIGLF